jgi:hypothetical protein
LELLHVRISWRAVLVIVDHREEHVNLIREVGAWHELQTQTADEIENDE